MNEGAYREDLHRDCRMELAAERRLRGEWEEKYAAATREAAAYRSSVRRNRLGTLLGVLLVSACVFGTYKIVAYAKRGDVSGVQARNNAEKEARAYFQRVIRVPEYTVYCAHSEPCSGRHDNDYYTCTAYTPTNQVSMCCDSDNPITNSGCEPR